MKCISKGVELAKKGKKLALESIIFIKNLHAKIKILIFALGKL